MGRREGAHAPRRLLPAGFRFMGWLLSHLLLFNLILGGIAAGVMAAPLAAGEGTLLCTTHVDGSPENVPADQHAPHCVLCPLAGATPLLAAPADFAVPLASPYVVEAPAPASRATFPPEVHESARPRAPPVPA